MKWADRLGFYLRDWVKYFVELFHYKRKAKKEKKAKTKKLKEAAKSFADKKLDSYTTNSGQQASSLTDLLEEVQSFQRKHYDEPLSKQSKKKQKAELEKELEALVDHVFSPYIPVEKRSSVTRHPDSKTTVISEYRKWRLLEIKPHGFPNYKALLISPHGEDKIALGLHAWYCKDTGQRVREDLSGWLEVEARKHKFSLDKSD